MIDTFVVAEHTGVRVEHKGNSVFWYEQRVDLFSSLIAEGENSSSESVWYHP